MAGLRRRFQGTITAQKGKLNCICCGGDSKKRGFYSNKNFTIQRFECLKCGGTFSEKQPLDNLRLDFKQAVRVVNLLCEGVDIRSISRLTGLHQQTVLNVLARAGGKCGRFLDHSIRSVKVESIQADEMFCFVGCKERNNLTKDVFRGDQYLFLATESKSKLIISHVIGKRTPSNTDALMMDLRMRVNGNFQLTTDGFGAYKVAVPKIIGKRADFAQLIKIYANPKESEIERRYSPSQCVGTKIEIRNGNPDPNHISTSYVERTNLTVRLFNRRFTRLTLGYSKKFEYLSHAINLFVAYYNFVWIHSAHGQTPAQNCGLKNQSMTLEEILLTPD